MPDRVQEEVGVDAVLEHDARLMLQVKAGDSTSFELLLVKYRSPMVNYLTRMVQNQGVAEELSQEVFLRVYKARESYEPTAKFTTWLYRIATHLALNSIRDRRHEKNQRSLQEEVEGRHKLEVRDTRANREQEMVAEIRLQVVRQAIADLPEKQRAAVVMHKYQELDYVHIAGALGCSVPAVKSLLFRAYETLRARLQHLGAGGTKGPIGREVA
jgi:RNA polymerase sigma-70 factor (ECF subfamily)